MAEKFTPIKGNKAEGPMKEAFDRTQEEWENHTFLSLYNKFQEYIRWFEGDQYGYVTGKKHSEWFDVSAFVDREVKNVYNRILPMIRQQHGDLIFDHEFYTIGATEESDDRRAAAVGSIIIEQTNHDRDLQRKLVEAKLLILLLGNCYWKEWWNKNLRGLSILKGKVVPVGGDIDFAVVSPFNFRPDPHAMSREEWRYVVEGKRVPTRSIELEFGLDRNSISNEGYQGFEQNRFTRHGIDTPKEPSAVRKEYWEFANAERSKGRFMVVANDMVLYDGDNPTPEAKCNYAHFKSGIPIIGTQFDESMVAIGQTPQRQINRHYSMVDEHFQNFRAKGLIPFGSLRPGDEQAFKRMGGVDFITYNPRVGQPYWQTPPALPESSLGYAQMLEGEFEIETSVRKTSYGQLPKYASRPSNQLFQSLKGADTSVMQPSLINIDAELIHCMRVRLSLAKKHYQEPRLIKNLGKGKLPAVRSFIGADLRDSTDVMVVPGVDIFTSRKRREDIAIKFVEMRAIDAKQALEIMRFKGVEGWLKEDKADEYQCNRHVEQMVTKKKFIPADPSDNHEFAYKFFNDFRKGEEFESLDETTQGFIIQRLNDHKEFLAMMPPPVEKPTQPGVPGTASLPGAEMATPLPAAGGVPIPQGGGNGGGVPPGLIEAIMAQMAGGEA
ncbi:MAG TPA: hypothetical protein VMV44_02700 [Rectinemataceae bacterium]|nr:hypothetical protein [Rectinemataceae bacterium]